MDTVVIDSTPELREALFHAICLLDHANLKNDNDFSDVAAAAELAKLHRKIAEVIDRSDCIA